MKIPTATYRIQFHQAFNFASAEAIAPYLAQLGISALYASPIFKARVGSPHGYDVVDPTQLNPELGSPEQFDALVETLQRHQIGWLQDIVPNHMAYDSHNAYLMDILEHGPDSEFCDFFDIEWNHAYDSFKGRVLTPLLGSFYGEALENGEIQLQYGEAGFEIAYHSLTLPVRIDSYPRFITHNLGQLAKRLGRQHPDFIKLLGVLYLIKSIAETKGRERLDQITFIKGLLWELYTQNGEVKSFWDENLAEFNGQPSNPESYNLLDGLLAEQYYRLSFWKVGAEEINYRRFFTVNELISVRVEEAKVFHKTHSLIEQWVQAGKVTGLRIDHIDGLYDPAQYLERLRTKVGDVYITVEKILELNETLPMDWPIQGTSGYDGLNYLNGVFCQPATARSLHHIYAQFTGLSTPYEPLMADKKRLIIERNLGGDVDNLAQRLKAIAGQTRSGGDFTAYGLKQALTEVLALFPVYRTYVAGGTVSQADRSAIQTAIAAAKEQVPLLLNELCYIEQLLLRTDDALPSPEQQAERLHFGMKFQQLTGPLMAKGAEDTALYVYNRLLSLNEVGGNPGQFGIALEQFHRFNQQNHDHFPHSMITTATHDTKRGEDVRSRLNVLSELPQDWETHLHQWSQLNQAHKTLIQDMPTPDANDEYFLYQTLLGAFPFDQRDWPRFIERIKAYGIKALREAKVHTAWLRPNSAYEDAYLHFIDQLLAPSAENDFLAAFRPFQQKIAEYGIYNSLSQVLLKYVSPGVPDLYQGCELWDLSLVDPDNRRPVDYEQRRTWLSEIQTLAKTDRLSLIRDLWHSKTDGRIKLFLTHQLLHARQRYADLFQLGSYQPLAVSGRFASHIVAFAREYQGQWAIAIAPRFLTSVVQPGELPLGETVWQDTQLQLGPEMPTQWHHVLSDRGVTGAGDRLSVGQALADCSVALLVHAP
jgi:(1->4)-alpha-D-glucan 1-alpha-D-glucosylmutase